MAGKSPDPVAASGVGAGTIGAVAGEGGEGEDLVGLTNRGMCFTMLGFTQPYGDGEGVGWVRSFKAVGAMAAP